MPSGRKRPEYHPGAFRQLGVLTGFTYEKGQKLPVGGPKSEEIIGNVSKAARLLTNLRLKGFPYATKASRKNLPGQYPPNSLLRILKENPKAREAFNEGYAIGIERRKRKREGRKRYPERKKKQPKRKK